MAALAVGPLGDAVRDLLPDSTSYAALVVIAVIATVLANLLWRRTLVRHGEHPSLVDFHRTSLVVTPITLLGAVTMLVLVTH